MTNRTDTFDRANSIISINSPSDGLGDYSGVGTWGIGSNTAREVSSASVDYAILESSITNVEVQATMSALPANDSAGLSARVVDVDNLIMARIHVSNAFQIYKRVGSTFTQVGSTYSYTPAAGDVIKLVVNGTSVSGYVNGVLRVGPSTVNDAVLQTSTKHGLFAMAETTARWDDLSITEIGGATTVPPGILKPSFFGFTPGFGR